MKVSIKWSSFKLSDKLSFKEEKHCNILEMTIFHKARPLCRKELPMRQFQLLVRTATPGNVIYYWSWSTLPKVASVQI